MTFGLELVFLAAAGCAAGAVNVVAGGGSFLTLPVLLFAGLPAPIANATNRVGVLAQNIAGVWGFHRHGALDWRWAGWTSLPALGGAAVGAWLALRIPAFAFARILSIAMLAVTLLSLWQSRRARDVGKAESPGAGSPRRAWVMGGFFLAGIYGGFIQAGVGFFILAMTSAAGLNLLRGNAVKLWGVLVMTLLSLVIFSQAGTIDWTRGAALAIGNVAGAAIGVRVAILKGHAWLDRAINITVIVFAILLWTT